MSKKHEQLRLSQTNSPTGKGIEMARKAIWILLIPIVAGAGIATCFAIVDDVREEIKLRAEKSKKLDCEISCPSELRNDELGRQAWNITQLLNDSSTP